MGSFWCKVYRSTQILAAYCAWRNNVITAGNRVDSSARARHMRAAYGFWEKATAPADCWWPSPGPIVSDPAVGFSEPYWLSKYRGPKCPGKRGLIGDEGVKHGNFKFNRY